ncbi:MAG TPA: OmpH family outer membrane protein [Terracidiphilus sp.]|nr:OmpH family outer membrane protein [Terracidiphilus sp.]
MNRTFALAVLLASGSVLNASAQTKAAAPAHSGTVKIAVISFQNAVTATNEFRRNYADLEKKFEPERQKLNSMKTDVDNLTKQLNAQTSTLSEAERASRTRTLNEKQRDLQRIAQDDQNDYQQELQDTFNGVATKVAKEMTDYAKLHGYDLVLDDSQQTTPVLYASNEVDITKAIVDDYNVHSGIPAPPAEAPSAPAPKPSGTR